MGKKDSDISFWVLPKAMDDNRFCKGNCRASLELRRGLKHAYNPRFSHPEEWLEFGCFAILL